MIDYDHVNIRANIRYPRICITYYFLYFMEFENLLLDCMSGKAKITIRMNPK